MLRLVVRALNADGDGDSEYALLDKFADVKDVEFEFAKEGQLYVKYR
ncbi:hypothetical protein ACQ858_13405 [Variovorax ureilyticus]